jgi:hypothetical protein
MLIEQGDALAGSGCTLQVEADLFEVLAQQGG